MPQRRNRPNTRLSPFRDGELDRVLDNVQRDSPFGSRARRSLRAAVRLASRTTFVDVQNKGASLRDRFEVLGIDGLLIEPKHGEEQFHLMPGFLGIEPDAFAHRRDFVVVAQPLAIGDIGPAVYAGLTTAKIDLRSKHHTHATLRTDGDEDKPQLWSEFGGIARIIRTEDDTKTGEQWAVIDLQPGSGPWKAQGFLTGTLDAATIVDNEVQKETVGVRIWTKDSEGNLATDTEVEITAHNLGEFTSGLEDHRAEIEFDGRFWEIVGLDCDASALSGASGPD